MTSKYWLSSTDSAVMHSPSTVSLQRDRKRVSAAKRPTGVLGDDSTSPLASDTMKVFPSMHAVVPTMSLIDHAPLSGSLR